jgi:hypothetical protein
MKNSPPKEPTEPPGDGGSDFPKENFSVTSLRREKATLDEDRLNNFKNSDLAELKNRVLLTPSHPMLESSYFIETEQASTFYNFVYDYVFGRKSGLYCMGEFRVGKTKAICNAILRLEVDMPWAAVFFHSAKRVTHQTKKAFCIDLMRSFNGGVFNGQNPEVLLSRYLMVQAIKSGSKTCVLFIDEAQMLTVLQMRYLLEVWNDLKIEGFILVTVLVGQKGLDSLKQLTGAEDHGAVVARFFANAFYIGGLHSFDQLSAYLEAFDSSLFFPPESNCSYSQFFCYKAFESGWRLAAEANNFWNSLLLYAKPSQKALRKSGFRLAFVNDAIHGFLLDSMKADKIQFRGTKKMWATAIEHAATADLLIGSGDDR